VALPLLMAITEGLWLRAQDEIYRTLAEQWAKGRPAKWVGSHGSMHRQGENA
jgi:hypothetical protein